MRKGKKKLKRNEESEIKAQSWFGKSKIISNIFVAEILVFHPDYECKSERSNGLV